MASREPPRRAPSRPAPCPVTRSSAADTPAGRDDRRRAAPRREGGTCDAVVLRGGGSALVLDGAAVGLGLGHADGLAGGELGEGLVHVADEGAALGGALFAVRRVVDGAPIDE